MVQMRKTTVVLVENNAAVKPPLLAYSRRYAAARLGGLGSSIRGAEKATCEGLTTAPAMNSKKKQLCSVEKEYQVPVSTGFPPRVETKSTNGQQESPHSEPLNNNTAMSFYARTPRSTMRCLERNTIGVSRREIPPKPTRGFGYPRRWSPYSAANNISSIPDICIIEYSTATVREYKHCF